MNRAAAHRGPDGEGVWTAPGIGLGHRRLAIIDLAGSPQPMHAADGSAVVVFNGEIYNFGALRRELAARGVRFRTHGDTEVILAAWQTWGRECLPRLDGMFAFALYDLRQRSLLLARDRLGVKPLHYATLTDGSVIFASELKQLLAHPGLRTEIDPLVIEDFMAWGYVPDHRSILRGCGKLAAGHSWLLPTGAGAPAPQRWWDVAFAPAPPRPQADAMAELDDLLGQAVRSRMVADVPLGAFLSGGVDSSAVVAHMAEASSTPVATCAIGFDDPALDETGYAALVAARYHTDHATRGVSHADFAELGNLAAMFDEPFADASALPTWRVCQLARERVTVALSGDGADEAFGGYRRQVFHHREAGWRALLPGAVRAPLFGTLAHCWPQPGWLPRPLRARATLASLAGDNDAAYAAALAYTRPAARDRLFSGAFRQVRGAYRAEQPLLALMAAAPAQSALGRAQYADLMVTLPGDILTKVDRTSMQVGLEAREPLLDHRLIEFAARLPDHWRVHGWTGKWLLKLTLRSRLPDAVLFRPKMGFVTPIAQWLRGPLALCAAQLATSGPLHRSGWFDPSALAALAAAHREGRADHSRTLWQLLVLEQSLARLDRSLAD